jgi:hypothetical protein
VQPNPETVAEIHGSVLRMLDDERSRGQGLDAKTSSLAGFTGAILALTAGLGRDFLGADAGAVADVLVRVVYVLAVGALAVAALIAVVGGLRPQERLAISSSELRSFAEYPLIAADRTEFEGRMVATLVEAVQHEREVNDRKALRVRRAALALAVGFAGVALEALTIAIVS